MGNAHGCPEHVPVLAQELQDDGSGAPTSIQGASKMSGKENSKFAARNGSKSAL